MRIQTCEWNTNTAALEATFRHWPTEVRLFLPHMITLRGEFEEPSGGWKGIHTASWNLMMVPWPIGDLEVNFIALPLHFEKLIDQVVLESADPQEAFTIMWDEVLCLAPEINKKLKALNVPRQFWLPD